MSQTIKSRFAASLAGNLLRSAISFSTGLILARWLGPEDYGRMVFLLASFTAIRGLLDMGSSAAFFTFLAQRSRSQRFINIFWFWVLMQLLITLGMVTIFLPNEFIVHMWLGESQPLLVLALFASFMQGTVWSLASQMAEASRETIRVQFLNTLVVSVHLSVIVLLWTIGQLALPLIFIAMIIEWSLAGWFAARMYTREKYKGSQEQDSVKSVWREFLHYCLPLIPYGWIGFFYDFADRWMLQNWGGPSEQAYYGVALQFSGVALLATTSVLRIFWKEIAEAYHNGDRQRVADLYTKVSRLLYFIGAALAGGLLPWTAQIVELTVGAAYVAGTSTVMLMFFFPVHQSMGQIGGTMLLATGHVRVQVILGSVFGFISLLVGYFMLAPLDAKIPGLALASQGLAWKMVILQLISVNVTAWVIARILNCKFDWLYQLVGLSGCIALGWFVSGLVQNILVYEFPILLQMIIAGILYGLCVTGFLYFNPWMAGTTRNEIKGHARQLMALRSAGA